MMVKRSLKVSALLRFEISNIIQTKVMDPRIGIVTIKDIVVSNDLRNAKIYFSTLGSDREQKETLKGLQRARSFIQYQLGMRLRMRYTPCLKFFLDVAQNNGISDIDEKK